jgi:hypothetical protein
MHFFETPHRTINVIFMSKDEELCFQFSSFYVLNELLIQKPKAPT